MGEGAARNGGCVYFAIAFRKGGEIYKMATTSKFNIEKATVQ